jgi:NTE family protein
MRESRTPRLGLALGAGSARGWAHLGVIRALEREGLRPEVVAGTSIGALVGAAYAAGKLDELESWVLELGVAEVLGFMDPSFGGGAFKGDRLIEFFRRRAADRPIETLPLAFGAVATSLTTGAEVWLRSGSLLEAVRASIALPGIFTPVRRDGAFLVDGGLVNPVPVSLARAMGADVVIAVDLGSDILGRRFRAASRSATAAAGVPKWIQELRATLGAAAEGETAEEGAMPSVPDVLAACMDIVLVRIARSRMAGEPPDVVVAPRLARLRLFDFHRAKEAIDEGYRAVERVASSLADLDAGPRDGPSAPA